MTPEQLQARVQHLENVIAVAASVLSRSALSHEDKEALLTMLRNALPQALAKFKEEHADAIGE